MIANKKIKEEKEGWVVDPIVFLIIDG